MADPQANKANAQAFYDRIFNQCLPRAAIERYVGETYTQHNPHVADGKGAFIAYFERIAAPVQRHQRACPETGAEVEPARLLAL